MKTVIRLTWMMWIFHLKIHPYQSRSGKFSKLNSKHTFVLGINASACWKSGTAGVLKTIFGIQ
ncbi:hypothetical protein RhiirC2_785354 [Rhizophagus irregularis]|uniref:Uncharacterized protein n=1 Tax=Rhizophagus irregularis TaxID=588596 RepID=A0A2N1MWK3_9GLOM|nr:hypothetical protein RhiirC2_785354 [Rhizophagus irregularis]